MRIHATLAAAALAVLTSHAALAQPGRPPGPSGRSGACEAKSADIERDLDDARARGQTRRMRGLETALREARANCSDAGLRREHGARVQRQERKVAERQRDLAEAKARGKRDKIARREAKLAEEEATLRSLRAGAR